MPRLTNLAAAALTAALLVIGSGAALAEGDAAQVDILRVDGGEVTFTVSVPAAPPGTVLVPERTAVRIAGRSTQAVAARPGAQAPATAVIVFDASGSMRGKPLEEAKSAAQRFVDVLPASVQVGLVTFADTARLTVAPTTNRATLDQAIQSVRAGGETALYDAVATAAKVPAADRTLVIMSDGGDTVSETDLTSAIKAVTGGGTRGEAIAFSTKEFDMAPLAALATAGRGKVRTAADGQALADAFVQAATGFTSRLDVTATVPEGTGGLAPMAVTVSDGAHSWTGSAMVQLAPLPSFQSGAQSPTRPGPAADSVGASGPEVVSTPTTWLFWLVGALAFMAVLLLVVAALPRRLSDAQRRARALGVYSVSGQRVGQTPGSPVPHQVVQGVLGASERFVELRGTAAGTALKLDRAGMALRPHEWLVVRISTVVGLAVVLVLLTGWVIRGILLGALLGWLGTALYLRWRQRRRTRAFGDSLADTLQLVASSLQTGFSLAQALDAAQQSGAQPMSGELGRALAAARIGSVLEDELDQVGVRMDSEDWRWAVMAMRIQHHVGGNLAEVLLTTVKTLRERAAMRRQARALSAEGRLSAYILIGLPIALFAFFLLVRREYVEKLWTTPLGLLMSLGAVVLMGLGTFWMSRVVKVEV
jgi:tight adherence protein B